jgi:hypothetical protein
MINLAVRVDRPERMIRDWVGFVHEDLDGADDFRTFNLDT